MKSMENIKGGVFAIGMKFGGFVLKGAADIVAAYFCNRLYLKQQIPTPDMRIL